MLTLNLRCACPSLPSAEITDVSTTPSLRGFLNGRQMSGEGNSHRLYYVSEAAPLEPKGSWGRAGGSTERHYG